MWWVLLGLAILFGPQVLNRDEREIPYSAFKQRLARGEVKELVLVPQRIRGLLREGEQRSADAESGEPEEALANWVSFSCVRPEDQSLIPSLDAAGVEYTVKAESPFGWLLVSWLPLLTLGLLIFFLFLRGAGRREGSSLIGFGRSRARLVPETGTGVTFGDVAGCDEAKADLQEMVEFLRDPARFRALGARIPKGVLLLGPPGTGKTLLARAVAGEAAVPFFCMNGSDFVEMFVGVGAARVRDLFVQAKSKAPCIVFIDEIDAVGRQRGVSMGVVNDEREQTLNQLLSEMDGFEENSGVIVLAATNRPEILDRALLRPGRFDRQVVLDAPERAGREAILRVHMRGKPAAPDVDLKRIAQATPGMSGADLANALNEAALAAARERRTQITQADIEQAIERVLAGPERRSRRLRPNEKRRVAYHEAGHALVAALSEHADMVEKISIIPRGKAALGYTFQVPQEEQYLRTRSELITRLRVLLGGRAAEEIVMQDISTGAQDDLEVATSLARQMVCIFGMSEEIGLLRCARPGEGPLFDWKGALQRDCSEETAHAVDEEVTRMLSEAFEGSRELLERNRPTLDRVAHALIEREVLDRSALVELFAGAGVACDGAVDRQEVKA
jgi:cell division protease FtsH